jgi:DNA-binding response OmpR family regulator
VLVVEDDPSAREALSFNLKRAGYHPVPAEDGEEGWTALERGPDRFDAVLLDRMMPRMDGMEVLRRVKEDERLRSLPVIMQTARAAREDIQEGLEAGAYYYLTKPFDRKTLLAIVRTAVSDSLEYRALRERARKTMGSFRLMVHGAYAFRTLEEAKLLATVLAQCSSRPEEIVMGLSELLVNAVEHGNLGITYDDKTRLLESEEWAGEVERRLDLPEYRDRKAVLEVDRRQGAVEYRIEDQGEGFDWRSYLEVSPERAFHTHGRGIALSRKLSFDSVEFVGRGNEVRAMKRESPAPPYGAAGRTR